MIQQPDDSPGLLWQVTLRWQRHITAALRPAGLTREVDAADTRARWLGTTDPGAALAPRPVEVVGALDIALLQALSADGATSFTTTLRRLLG